MAQTTNPTTELRRITRRISELQARQRELIGELGLAESAERIILRVLDLANDVNVFAEKAGLEGIETTARQRQRIVLSKKVSKAFERLNRLPESEARAAAIQALTEAASRLLEKFGVPA